MIVKKRSSLKILLLLIVLLMSTGLRCKCVSQDVRNQLKPITLEYWGVWNESKNLEPIIAAYQAIHPNITVHYKKLRYEEYERMLLDAWAEGRGPDVFSIHNTWVPKYQSKIAVMPKKYDMPYVTYEAPLPGCDRKTEEIVEVETKITPTPTDIKRDYSGTVYYDVLLRDENGSMGIYALPLSLDTLALFYNIDLLDRENIPFPPSDWDEFIEDVRLLTKVDVDQNIIQSGAAMGTYDNIERAFDILSLLLMQNGGSLDELGDARTTEALNFYLDFANPDKEIYTWNNKMVNSLDAFVEGKLAFFFGYSYHIPMIKAKAPTLNFSVSSVPQINLSKPINYANYWVETVYKRGKYTKEAWDFILFLSKQENVKKFLKETKGPTALRSLIKEQENDPQIKPFAAQILTAESWHGYSNFNYIEEGFQEMFESIYNAPEDAEGKAADYAKFLKEAKSKVIRAK